MKLIVEHAERVSDFISVGFGYRQMDAGSQHFITRLGELKVGAVDIDAHHSGDVRLRGLLRLEVFGDGAALCSTQSMVVRKIRSVAACLALPSIN